MRRVRDHKQHLVDGFTRRYRVDNLVWYEAYESMATAIAREKALKNGHRAWRLRLIETENPDWQDLYPTLV